LRLAVRGIARDAQPPVERVVEEQPAHDIGFGPEPNVAASQQPWDRHGQVMAWVAAVSERRPDRRRRPRHHRHDPRQIGAAPQPHRHVSAQAATDDRAQTAFEPHGSSTTVFA
jgi:hypothetical protein